MRRHSEPETLVGHCCGCRVYPIALFKIPKNVYRYRCADCFALEMGYRHHLCPNSAPEPTATSRTDADSPAGALSTPGGATL